MSNFTLKNVVISRITLRLIDQKRTTHVVISVDTKDWIGHKDKKMWSYVRINWERLVVKIKTNGYRTIRTTLDPVGD